MSQKIENIAVKDLVLWTENPRDPIDSNSSDQEIANRAIGDMKQKWNLEKFAMSMGDEFDFSELPTVVFKDKKPIVYDGNRRILLAKAKLGFVKIGDKKYKIAKFPEIIPCNVCDEKTALRNVYRKHVDSGSWDALERDIFVDKHLNEGKSFFLALEEATKLISSNPHLNKDFVRKEILTKEKLSQIGISIKDGKISSRHDEKATKEILLDLSNQVKEGEITTRKKRGQVYEVLTDSSRTIVDNNKNKKFENKNLTFSENETYVSDIPTAQNLDSGANEATPVSIQKHSKRVQSKAVELFGGKLILKTGDVNNLYRDICDLFDYYTRNKEALSVRFPSLIRMSLRLIIETAAKDQKIQMDAYIKNNFVSAKSNLSQDEKTTLHTHSISDTTLVSHLHIGAHNYAAAANIDQTLAISLVVGRMVTSTHGKK